MRTTKRFSRRAPVAAVMALALCLIAPSAIATSQHPDARPCADINGDKDTFSYTITEDPEAEDNSATFGIDLDPSTDEDPTEGDTVTGQFEATITLADSLCDGGELRVQATRTYWDDSLGDWVVVDSSTETFATTESVSSFTVKASFNWDVPNEWEPGDENQECVELVASTHMGSATLDVAPNGQPLKVGAGCDSGGGSTIFW